MKTSEIFRDKDIRTEMNSFLSMISLDFSKDQKNKTSGIFYFLFFNSYPETFIDLTVLTFFEYDMNKSNG